jgi:hypothetical protein
MEEAPENGKELLHSARANGMNELLIYSAKLTSRQKPELIQHCMIFNTQTRGTRFHGGAVSACCGNITGLINTLGAGGGGFVNAGVGMFKVVVFLVNTVPVEVTLGRK